ncbi:hypothetical protein L0F63_005670 [Massospora cicadina]|nr:hypothetical protein L0F63_005670 [Massospora cicadina]
MSVLKRAAGAAEDVPEINGGQYWLMKAEPESRLVNGVDVKFSIDDLEAQPRQTSAWDGVRNYEARNFMRDRMRLGDKVLFYHSNCKVPGVAGIAEVVREGYPDVHPNTRPGGLRYVVMDRYNLSAKVDVKLVNKFTKVLPLKSLREPRHQRVLSNLVLLRRPQLSVQPVTPREFEYISSLATDTNA